MFIEKRTPFFYWEKTRASSLYVALLHAGDIESMPFIEALGQFSYHVGQSCLSINLFDEPS